MVRRIADNACIAEGAAHLRAVDPRWISILDAAGAIPLRLRAPGFEGLAGIVVAQQLSVASARAIWSRFATAIDPMTPERLMAASDDDLRAVGLSRPKQRTLRAVSTAMLAGGLDLDALAALDPDAARAAMTVVAGVGPWTADIYLMFCLGHADAFAPGDLALQEAARIGFVLSARPDPKALTALSESWRPWRGVAARALWAYYAVAKSRDGVA